MLIPKASHLVERVAERLLRSGALDDSAAQLLQPGSAPVPAGASADPDPAEPTQRSSPSAALPAEQPYVSPPVLASVVALEADRASASSLTVPAPVLPSVVPHVIHAPRPASGQVAGQDDTQAMADHPAETAAEATASERPSVAPTPSPYGGTVGLASAPVPAQDSVDAVSLERAGMIDWSRTRSRISEEFRLVQRQILRSAFGAGAEPGFSNLLLVTSSRPGEGKSFMATNLAGSIARQGDHHVLLVDADSKRDSICYSLGLAQARGLLDLAANPKLDPALLIVRTPIDRLSVLPVGRERERSAELFSTKDMTRLIQDLGRRYADRLLILDAPPCLSTSDPAVLAQVVGQILFVVEADRTQRNEVEASLDLIQACPTITLVLNKQQISSRYTFGAYSSYYSS